MPVPPQNDSTKNLRHSNTPRDPARHHSHLCCCALLARLRATPCIGLLRAYCCLASPSHCRRHTTSICCMNHRTLPGNDRLTGRAAPSREVGKFAHVPARAWDTYKKWHGCAFQPRSQRLQPSHWDSLGNCSDAEYRSIEEGRLPEV